MMAIENIYNLRKIHRLYYRDLNTSQSAINLQHHFLLAIVMNSNKYNNPHLHKYINHKKK